jgi:hypothetical protein
MDAATDAVLSADSVRYGVCYEVARFGAYAKTIWFMRKRKQRTPVAIANKLFNL